MMWTLDDALKFIRTHQKEVMEDTGHYLCLAGGVLNNGESDSDLDLVAVPRRPLKTNPEKLIVWLRSKGFRQSESVKFHSNGWQVKGWEPENCKLIEILIIVENNND